jgi:hypothetical protein
LSDKQTSALYAGAGGKGKGLSPEARLTSGLWLITTRAPIASGRTTCFNRRCLIV